MHGTAAVLQLRPCTIDPSTVTLKPDEALVANTYAGVNFIDTYYRSGLYTKPTMPYVPGEEGAGTVVKLGENSSKDDGIAVGSRVAYFGATVTGSYAALSVVKRASLVPVPDTVDDKSAAAVACQGLTAHYLAYDSYPCGPGSVVVVHAAAGGTGLLLCQIAKMRGAFVIGVCGGKGKAELATTVGRCDAVVDYTACDKDDGWVAAIRHIAEMTPACAEGVKAKGGIDAVYDGVGAATFRGSLSLLKPRGYMISFGNASGAVPPIAPLDLMKAGSVYLQRPTLMSYLRTPEELAARCADVFGWVAEGKLAITIGAVMPLAEAGKAQAELEARRTTGKLLLDCR